MLQMKKWKGVIIDEGMERGESQQQKYWPQIIRKSIKDPKVTLGDEICYGVDKSFDVALARADALLMLTENPTNRKVEGYQFGWKNGTVYLKGEIIGISEKIYITLRCGKLY